jgi:hypothetical protein
LFHHSRRNIRKVLEMADPKPYVRLNPPPSILDPLADDEGVAQAATHCQEDRRRLRDELGYLGGYERVCVYVRERHRCQRETFIPITTIQGNASKRTWPHLCGPPSSRPRPIWPTCKRREPAHVEGDQPRLQRRDEKLNEQRPGRDSPLARKASRSRSQLRQWRRSPGWLRLFALTSRPALHPRGLLSARRL